MDAAAIDAEGKTPSARRETRAAQTDATVLKF
jgi:hypothetical protein